MGWVFSEDIELIEFKDLVFPETHELFLLIRPNEVPDEKLKARLNQIQERMKYEIRWVCVDEFQYYSRQLGRENIFSDRILSECELPNFFVLKSTKELISKAYERRKQERGNNAQKKRP